MANFPGRPSRDFPQSPFASTHPVVGPEAPAASRTMTPFLPTGPVAGSVPSGAPVAPTGPVAGSGIAGAPQPMLPFLPSTRFNGPLSSPLPPSYPVQDASSYQQTQGPRFPATTQAMHPMRSPPGVGPPVIPPPGSLRPQQQVPLVPMGLPPQTANQVPPIGMMPQPTTEQPFSAPRLLAQPPLHGYPNVLPRVNVLPPPTDSQFPVPRPMSQLPQPFTATHAPPGQPPFHVPQGGLVSPQPPIGVPLGGPREQMPYHYPMAGPPLGGTVQSLVEDFQSLSIGSAPGSLDPGVDPNLLPRPLDGDEGPTSVMETYPLNCHPRFFRLTTHAIPSSQSLLARWHLPLGVVVHPLAETPDGEEVPVVNFGKAGIVRCRRCRLYINPYVTFTDAGRKWRCNHCSLLNDDITWGL